MGSRQADVFVKMKSFYLGPVDSRRFGQSIQKLQLRGSGRGYDPRVATLCDRAANGRHGLRGSCLPERDPIFEHSKKHESRDLRGSGLLSWSRQIIQKSAAEQR